MMTFVIPIARTRWRNAGPYDLSRSGTGNVPMAMPAQHLADVVAHHPGRGALLSLDRPGSGVHPRGCSHHGGCVRCDHFKRALLVSFATAPPPRTANCHHGLPEKRIGTWSANRAAPPPITRVAVGGLQGGDARPTMRPMPDWLAFSTRRRVSIQSASRHQKTLQSGLKSPDRL